MKLNQIKELVRQIVNESLDALEEGYQTGEWWIFEDGSTEFADGEVGDMNHEAVVIRHVTYEILSHFGIDTDEPGYLGDYEESIRESLLSDGRISQQESEDWMMDGGYDQIIKILLEDKVYTDPKQANEAVRLAYGSRSSETGTLDARNYGMKYLHWKIMKTFHGSLEVQTWTLTADDLGAIVRGIWDIMDEDDMGEDEDTVNITVQASGKRFINIPISALEKKLPTSVLPYQSGVHTGFREGLNEDYHFHHKEYRMYEGTSKIVVAFEDNSRLMFEIHYRHNRGIDREKWRHKAMTKWKSLANELYRDVPLSDACNPIQKTWRECFAEALKNPEMAEFIRDNHHQKVFPDRGVVADPVNFTPRV